ncbi:MAG: PAS domain S-box protein [Bryobacteraceae bacterium]|nr:PAS domain S-box protein [Bryobacteraceae bacterium]MDW8378441.1 PAS domain S-box protein [Bryobacterales bacterium]
MKQLAQPFDSIGESFAETPGVAAKNHSSGQNNSPHSDVKRQNTCQNTALAHGEPSQITPIPVSPIDSQTIDANVFWDTSLDAMRLTDNNGIILRVNDAFCRLMAKPRHELIGQPFTCTYAESDRDRILAGYRHRMASGQIQLRLHRPMRRWDGVTLWVDSSATVVETAQGAVVLTVLRDITPLKNAEERLRRERARLEGLLSAMRLGTCEWRLADGSAWFSPRWADIAGYSPNELPPHIDTWRQSIHPEDLPSLDLSIAAHLSGKTSFFESEHRIRHKHGHWVWVYCCGHVAARDENKTPLSIGCSLADISERKQMEAMLRRSRDEARRLALIAQRTTDAVALLDPQGRIEWVNPGFERMTGCPAAHALGQHALNILLSDRAETTRHRLQHSMSAGVREQVLGKLHSGGEIWLDLELQPILSEQGNLLGFSAVASDVTPHVNLRTRLESIVDALAEGLILVDANGFILDCNPRGSEILGVARELILGQSIKSVDWCAVDSNNQPLEEFEFPCMRVLRTGIPIRAAIIGITRPDGQRIWLEVNAWPLRDGFGNLTGAVSSFSDVTERRRMQQQILESEARFRALADGVPIMVWMAGPNGEWTDCNRSWLEFTGAPLQPGERLGWTRRIHPEDELRCRICYQSAITHRQPLQLEFRLLRHDGLYRWVLDRCAPRWSASGEFLGFVGGCVDITERRETEQKLLEANLRIRHLAEALEQAPASVFLCDQSGIITYVNRTFCEVSGYQPDEVLGKPSQLFQPENPQLDATTRKQIWDCLSNGLPWRGELLNHKKNGEPFWELTLLAPLLDDSGATSGFLCVKEDITSRKKFEEDLQQTNQRLQETIARAQELACRAEAANVAKSEFLANMSHEIRTPMNGILGAAGLLLETPLNHEQREHVEVICTSAESLLTLINDLLDLSKIEAGRLEIESVETSLRAVVQAVAAMLGPLARKKGLEFESKIHPAIPEVVLGDPGRLRQVLVNLVGNAVKFTDSGRIEMNVMPLPNPSHPAGPSPETLLVKFSVRDTGIGIAPHQLERLFEKFTQLDSSPSRRHGGTGLGLAISRRLVNMMGGKIDVISELGKGSEFWFTVPFRLPQPAHHPTTPARSSDSTAEENSGLAPVAPDLPAQPAAPPPPAASFSRFKCEPQLVEALTRRQARVLLAEDNAINRRVAIAILRRLGVSVDAVVNGQEAVHAVQHSRYDLVLMDVHMPQTDGLEAARAIRNLPGPSSRIPIIAMTASVMAQDRDLCSQAGMNDFLSKPIEVAALAQVLSQWLLDHPLTNQHAVSAPATPSATAPPVGTPA